MKGKHYCKVINEFYRIHQYLSGVHFFSINFVHHNDIYCSLESKQLLSETFFYLTAIYKTKKY